MNPTILVLTERRKAARDLCERFKQLGIPSGVMLGGTVDREETERTKEGLKNGSIRVAVATTVADEALDFPMLTHVVCTCPVHTHLSRLAQMVGRAARPFECKKHATCIYFWDEKLFPGNEAKNVKFLEKFEEVFENIKEFEF